FLPLMTYFLLMNAMAANGENNPSNLLGAPVNTAISGGSVLPDCSSDTLAQGAMMEAESRGLRIPHDLAVIGFGDLDFAASNRPS
ncbi:substrate-binding domain-containing protein, partial [Salmonella enterica subsp. enterica serovar Kentucky]|nr:substrate-binding domain-containing protein [Salmonella enterica subsp. enterica serovar Kentucky]